MAAVAGGWVDRGMAQVVPDLDSAWVAEEWVEAAVRARVVVPVGARAPAAPAVACGNRPGAEVEELAAEAVPAEVVVDLEGEPGPVAVVLVAPAGPEELGVGAAVVEEEAEDMEVDLAPAVDPERAPEAGEAEASLVRREDG